MLLTLAVGLSACDSSSSSKPAKPPTSSATAAAAGPSVAKSAESSKPKVPTVRLTPMVPTQRVTWKWEDTPIGEMQALVSIPAHRKGQRLPVLIAFHGRGEALKGPKLGARGWVDDYWLPKALRRVRKPPLTKDDLQGFADERLDLLNQGLRQRPYRGLIIVNPYTPDRLRGNRPFAAARPLAQWVKDELLPKIQKETPARTAPGSVGIDGVSLGGRAALLVGFIEPQLFGAVTGLQAAFDEDDHELLVDAAVVAREKHPKLKIRLLTSEGDFYLKINQTISKKLKAKGIDHQLVVVPGDHSYRFNRGPGVYEMLLYHDRVLRGEEPI